jgi:hypothetical protein
MRRRLLLRVLLLALGIPLFVWGIGVALSLRPNPILVTVGPRDDGRPEPPTPAVPAAAAGVSFVEVEVARARAISMKVLDMPVRGRGMTVGTMPEADTDAVAAEEKELRAALDPWLAEPGRGLKIEQSWTSGEMSVRFFHTSQRYRAILRARLVSAGRK